jgi:hypothetical protein
MNKIDVSSHNDLDDDKGISGHVNLDDDAKVSI